jgi:hypothetical protein
MAANATGLSPLNKARRIVVIQLGDVSWTDTREQALREANKLFWPRV